MDQWAHRVWKIPFTVIPLRISSPAASVTSRISAGDTACTPVAGIALYKYNTKKVTCLQRIPRRGTRQKLDGGLLAPIFPLKSSWATPVANLCFFSSAVCAPNFEISGRPCCDLRASEGEFSGRGTMAFGRLHHPASWSSPGWQGENRRTLLLPTRPQHQGAAEGEYIPYLPT